MLQQVAAVTGMCRRLPLLPPSPCDCGTTQAADRLKAIHDAEAAQDLAAVPSYMQPTAVSVVRKAPRKLASKVVASGYDPRWVARAGSDGAGWLAVHDCGKRACRCSVIKEVVCAV